MSRASEKNNKTNETQGNKTQRNEQQQKEESGQEKTRKPQGGTTHRYGGKGAGKQMNQNQRDNKKK